MTTLAIAAAAPAASYSAAPSADTSPLLTELISQIVEGRPFSAEFRARAVAYAPATVGEGIEWILAGDATGVP